MSPNHRARAEGLHLLEVLACLTRRPLPLLAPGSIAALAPVLSTGLAPTLLINAEMLHHEKLGFWLTSTARSARVIVAGKLVDISAARVIFVGESLESPPLDQPMLVVNTETSDGLLPVISRDRQAELASRFQPQLLEYRVRNFVKIRASTADLPGAPAAIRISARILGAIALDAPELQACSRRVLDHLQGIHANQFWLDPRALVIEAALARCHDPAKAEILVGELTADVIALFAGRGEQCDISPRKIGAILESIGVPREKFRDGRKVQFTDQTRLKLHRLARSYGIPVNEQSAAKCTECLGSITGEPPMTTRNKVNM